VFTGTAPFGGNPCFVAALAIVQGRRPPQPTHPTFTGELWALVQRCWDQDPHLRPEIPEVLGVLRSLSVSRLLLQQFRHLEGSSSGFNDRLSNILYGEEYRRFVQGLQGDDLVWLIDYLDKVHRHVALPCSPLSYHRFSMVSILPAALLGSACANSEQYVALE